MIASTCQLTIYLTIRNNLWQRSKTIFIRLKTRWEGTDSHPYVGIHGREFYIDAVYPDDEHEDFEGGEDRTYICGEIPSTTPNNWTQVFYPYLSDHRRLCLLNTASLDLYPGILANWTGRR